MGMMLVAGFGMMQGMASSNTIIQTIVSEDKRGRVMSYYTIAFVGMAPSAACWPGPCALVRAPLTVILNGATVILGAAWFTTRLPPCAQPSTPIYSRDGNPAVEVVSGMTAGGAS